MGRQPVTAGTGVEILADLLGMHGAMNVGGRVHIILMSDRLAKARTIQVSLRQVAAATAAAAAGVVALSSLISYFGVRHASDLKLPLLHSLVRAAQVEESQKTEAYVRENLNVMAVKLGEMQAQPCVWMPSASGCRPRRDPPGEFRFGRFRDAGALTSALPPQDLLARRPVGSSTSWRARWRPAATSRGA
jgi:hypothetical protein